ncbi:MAG: alpha/beta hydrolase family protein [Gemmatimonadaceae bacterium]
MQLESFEVWRNRGEKAPLIVRGEAWLPDAPAGTVVICHGFKGFARFAFFPQLAGKLAEAGLTAITFDFSGSGIGEDRENFTNQLAFTHNTFTQELDDIEAVVAEARVHGWIGGGYGLMGHSRGGGMAILHAARDADVNALVTWAAISHVSRWPPEQVADWRQRGYIDVPNARTGQTIPVSIELLGEIEELGETRLNIAAAAERVRAPWLIIHGDADETVSVSEAQHLAAIAGNTCRLSVIEGGNHTLGGKHPLAEVPPILERATSETVGFFVEHLAGKSM